jgi:predicted dehydrogenase
MQAPGTPSIRVALLGADDTARAIAQAIAKGGRFELAGICELDDRAEAELARCLGIEGARLRRFAEWESLLDRQQTDVVVVAPDVDDDRRAEQLRKLIQTGVPVIASHPVVDSMLVYYELDMIRRDTQSVLLPYLPDRHHPAISEIRAMAADGENSPIGKLEQVVVLRRLPHTDRPTALSSFARDVDLIRGIAGDMTRLGAMAAAADGGFSSLGVQMSGPTGVVARWSVEPVHESSGGRLEVLGTKGKVLVEMRDDREPWSLTLSSAGKTQTQSFDRWTPAAAALGQLELALGGQTPQPDWVDAARSIELAETIDRSLEKSRTIDLYYEEYTEEGTFKGTMTSIGCGLLILTLFLMGAVAIADHVGLPYARYWPYLLLGGLGAFLLLQLLMLVFRTGDEGRAQ